MLRSERRPGTPEPWTHKGLRLVEIGIRCRKPQRASPPRRHRNPGALRSGTAFPFSGNTGIKFPRRKTGPADQVVWEISRDIARRWNQRSERTCLEVTRVRVRTGVQSRTRGYRLLLSRWRGLDILLTQWELQTVFLIFPLSRFFAGLEQRVGPRVCAEAVGRSQSQPVRLRHAFAEPPAIDFCWMRTINFDPRCRAPCHGRWCLARTPGLMALATSSQDTRSNP